MLAPFNPANCPPHNRPTSSPPGWRGASRSRTQRATCAPHTSEPGRRRIGDRAGAAHRHPGHDQADKVRTTERIANPAPYPEGRFLRDAPCPPRRRREWCALNRPAPPPCSSYLPRSWPPPAPGMRPMPSQPGREPPWSGVGWPLMGGSSHECACAPSSVSFGRARAHGAGLSGVRSYRGRWSRCGRAVGDQDQRRGYRAPFGEGIPVSNQTKGSHSK
jgi:hypothetical protein